MKGSLSDSHSFSLQENQVVRGSLLAEVKRFFLFPRVTHLGGIRLASLLVPPGILARARLALSVLRLGSRSNIIYADDKMGSYRLRHQFYRRGQPFSHEKEKAKCNKGVIKPQGKRTESRWKLIGGSVDACTLSDMQHCIGLAWTAPKHTLLCH